VRTSRRLMDMIYMLLYRVRQLVLFLLSVRISDIYRSSFLWNSTDLTLFYGYVYRRYFQISAVSAWLACGLSVVISLTENGDVQRNLGLAHGVK
jgi:hypothetical protein